MKFIKKIILFFVSLLPAEAPRYIYTTLLRPKALRRLTNYVICMFIGEKIKIPEGYIALNKKDPIISGSLALGCYEGVETNLIKEKIKKGMIVVDVGANIGYFSVIASKLVGETGRVISFEPGAENFEYLKKTIELNNFKNVIPCNIALSDRGGEIEFFISDENMGDHRIYKSKEKRQSVKVKSATMDEYLQYLGYDKVDFVKIDVQGVEWLVLRGMNNVILNNPKINMLIEFWPHGITESGGDSVLSLNILEQKGFKIYNVGHKDGELELVDDYQRFTDGINGKAYVNLYCARS